MVMNVSIVIPTYNRKPILQKCLKALENQNLDENISNYEVIVVDDGSTDGTTSWIEITIKFYLMSSCTNKNMVDLL